MSNEVRVMSEGQLWWVQASGTAASGTRSWSTASAPASGLFGYVQSFSFTSGVNKLVMNDRGIPQHHKLTMRNPIDVTVSFQWTGANPTPATANGTTVPQFHLEYRASAAEVGTNSAVYYQFHGVAQSQLQWTENAEGDTLQMTLQALAMNGPTASGYIK